jgi:hypothetical protein
MRANVTPIFPPKVNTGVLITGEGEFQRVMKRVMVCLCQGVRHYAKSYVTLNKPAPL